VSEVAAYGLAVDPPSGWDSRIYRRTEAGQAQATTENQPPGNPAPLGAITLPVVQVATIALPADAADYGSDIVEDLGASDAFVVLKEFEPASALQPLFAAEGMPAALTPEQFSPGTLQRSLTGQAGYQSFFHVGGRAFCLYVVLGSYDARLQLVPRVNAVLTSLRIDPASP
jgi:hypothetical protein